jgi:amino acid adenylation domain-containing protein
MHHRMTTACKVSPLTVQVDEQAARTPHAAAIISGDTRISYRELQAQTNRIANFLRNRGVSRGTRVGLLVERGEGEMENILYLFGILKAGAVYVPLDTKLPPERFAFMLSDARIQFVLAPHRLNLSRFPLTPGTGSSPQVLCMNELKEDVARASSDQPPLDAQPGIRDVAYIMYTTGSTGKPKGVVVGHRSLAHYARVQNAALGTEPGDRATQFFALTFDASWSDLTMLAAGVSLYPVPANALLGGQALFDFLQDNAITVATFVPSLWLTLPSYDLPKLRLLIVGGEVCPKSLVHKSFRSGRRIYNAYGLTETTVCICMGECKLSDAFPPIGKPFPGIEVSIRDERLHPVVRGVAGHLCVSGVCLALGYTDEELTSTRFVADPLDPSRQIFLTNDEALCAPDGTLTFLGRRDSTRRLKLAGGKLVNLDEIEAVLLSHQDVRACAVEALEGRIVAFVSLVSSASKEAAPIWEETECRVRKALSGFLRQHLFDYMCPHAYVILPALPRTVSDKIDRIALREEVPITWWVEAETPVQASTPVERKLAEIVADMLTEKLLMLVVLKKQLESPLFREEAESPLELPKITWQQVNVAHAATEQGDLSLDSLDAPDFTLRVSERCGVSLENRELFVPLTHVARAVEYLQQRSDDPGTLAAPRREGGVS